ncbi:MAG TPA: type II toxin-antitoxin system HicB family antitoxin [Anaerolineales bacterium]|nr:type II toxin-antitoxin system HicB family antitoxin [Anaerolineales bacterium]
MPYVVCAEEVEDRWVAHVPDLPGCFASDKERDEAINAVPAAIQEYVAWCSGHGLHVSGISGPMVVDEVIRSWMYEDDYEVNAFFAADRPPILPDEVAEIQLLLSATRSDLSSAVADLDEEALLKELAGERWPVAGILGHLAGSEWWYLDRLGLAFSRADLPEDPFERLRTVRDHLLASLPVLPRRLGVVTLGGETWSARKVIRRTLWHERNHTHHILRLRTRLA